MVCSWFLSALYFRYIDSFLPEVSATAKFLSGWCETIALAAIGLRLNLVEFIKAGKKLLIYGLSTLVFQVVLALILISLLIK